MVIDDDGSDRPALQGLSATPAEREECGQSHATAHASTGRQPAGCQHLHIPGVATPWGPPRQHATRAVNSSPPALATPPRTQLPLLLPVALSGTRHAGPPGKQRIDCPAGRGTRRMMGPCLHSIWRWHPQARHQASSHPARSPGLGAVKSLLGILTSSRDDVAQVQTPGSRPDGEHQPDRLSRPTSECFPAAAAKSRGF
jgi:hypothetical protein